VITSYPELYTGNDLNNRIILINSNKIETGTYKLSLILGVHAKIEKYLNLRLHIEKTKQ